MIEPGEQYYKFRGENTERAPGYDYQLMMYQYKDVWIHRDNVFLLWSIKKDKEGTEPVVPLRGSFTIKSKAEAHYDKWLEEEERRQSMVTEKK